MKSNLGLNATVLALLSVSILGACTSSSKSDDTSAKKSGGLFSSKENKASARNDVKTGYRLPNYEEKRLENGLRILFVPDQALPYVSYSLLVRVGAAQDPKDLSGLSSMVAELLDKGTKKRTAPQIAAEIGQMGADFDATGGMEYSTVAASGIATQADSLLNNMIEVVTEPTFSDSEVERLRKQMLAGIERRVDNPDAFTELAFDSFLFGEHPYGRPVNGTLKTVGAIKKKHIISQYLRYYRPNNAILAVVGQYTPELRAKIEKQFGAWQPREVAPSKYPPIAPPTGLQVELVDKPSLVQTQIRMGQLGIKRQSDDFVALRLANTILGGAFASRLNNRVRKELGLTYSIHSAFDARLDSGSFEISTFTKNNTVGQTLTETLKTLRDFKEKGVSKEEVEQTKGYLKGVFPQAIETPEKLAFNLMLLRFYDIPDTYLTGYLNEVDRLSTGDINKVIKRYFDDKNLKVVVYSNGAEAQPQLQQFVDASAGKLEIKKSAELQ